jgi:ABC-2 type transport system ATP-binding protein
MTLAIQLEDLRKTFGHTVRALDGVSFGVETGAIFGLLGPNGAGRRPSSESWRRCSRPMAAAPRSLVTM